MENQPAHLDKVFTAIKILLGICVIIFFIISANISTSGIVLILAILLIFAVRQYLFSKAQNKRKIKASMVGQEQEDTAIHDYEIETDDDSPSPLRYLTHSTQWPAILGALWFFGFLAAFGLFPQIFAPLKQLSPQTRGLILLVPAPFLFGLRGLLIILHGEAVDKSGRIVKGTSAYFDGIATLIISWGYGIFLFFDFK